MNFRFGTVEALATLMLRSQEGTAFWDDFYVSPGEDLSEPPHRVLGDGFQITEFYYFPGLSVELSWSAIAGHEYAIDRSEDLATQPFLIPSPRLVRRPVTELFDDAISTSSGRLYYLVRDLGVPLEGRPCHLKVVVRNPRRCLKNGSLEILRISPHPIENPNENQIDPQATVVWSSAAPPRPSQRSL